MAVTETIYKDSRGWKYKARSGIGEDTFKVFYCKPGKRGYHGCRIFSWRDSLDAAQSDLDTYAREHGWQKIIEERDV